ncbi:hypothetical protein FQN57_003215 [Myotisia sp. PD_48]|nr:hypothetical protein FQN57_003215 [Myotisia sp. PD_48]
MTVPSNAGDDTGGKPGNSPLWWQFWKSKERDIIPQDTTTNQQRRTSITESIIQSLSSAIRPQQQNPSDIDRENVLDPEIDMEKLGRMRPAVFKNFGSELAFGFSIVMSQVLAEYFISGFNVIIPRLVDEFDIPDAAAVWPASAFSLVVAATLLFFGRLTDMMGGYIIYVSGMAWLCVWSIIAGFSKNRLMLIICRALQGLGPAAYLPSGMMLLAVIYRPGPRKNMVFSIYGTCAVIGFFAGIFFSGLAAQYLDWQWYFWIGAILAAVTTVSSWYFIPSDSGERNLEIKMDWWGTGLIISGLTLTVFAITDSAHASNGWKTPYVLVCFIIGCLLLAGAVYVEGWVAEWPLLPFDLFQVPYMKAMVLALLFFYGCFGTFLLYGTLYMTHIMNASPMQVVVWCVPMVVGGFVFPMAVGICLHLVSGTILLAVSGLGWIAANVLFAVMPDNASYWPYVFPAMICATLGIDVTYNITNIFITTNQPKHRQGLAGALINSVLHLSIAVLLGIADIAQVSTLHRGRKESYQVVFWFCVACAASAFVIMVGFVRVTPAKSEMTVDEKKRQEAATMQQLGHPGGEKAGMDLRQDQGSGTEYPTRPRDTMV